MNEPRTPFDDAIDRAVRDLVRRDPPAGLRGRVLARLHEPPRRMPLWPGLAIASAALAIVAFGELVRRGTSEPPARVPHAETTTTSAPVVEPITTAPANAPSRVERSERAHRALGAEPVRTATFGPRDGRVSAATLAVSPETPVEPASPPAAAARDEQQSPSLSLTPIVVPPLTPPTPLEIAPLVVPPIHVPRMQMTPVSPPR